MKRKFNVKNQLKQKPGIYKISCTESDKVYVGESVDISRRMQKHFSLLRHNKHSNPILQNVFNKYGEETFIVEVLEYTDFSDELSLKKLEKEYQGKEQNCISLDFNEIFCIERTEEWKKKQGEMLNSYREKMLDELIRKPVIVYDIINKTHIRYRQISDAEELVERKHIHKNINEKILIPFKHQYVVFLEEEFTEENIAKIITVNSENIKYGAVRNLCSLHNLHTGETKYFASKVQFSYEFSKSKNDKLYDKYLKEDIIDFHFRCVNIPVNKDEFWNRDIYIRDTSRTKRVNIKTWYNALNKCKTNIEIGNCCNIDRKLAGLALSERSRIEWIKMIDQAVSALPD